MRDIVSTFCKADKLVSWETECLHSVKRTNPYHERHSVYILQSGQTRIMGDRVSTFCKVDKPVAWETVSTFCKVDKPVSWESGETRIMGEWRQSVYIL